MENFELQEQYVPAEDEEVARPKPLHVRILVGMVFVPAVVLALLWGVFREMILGVVPASAQRTAEQLLYYSGLACAAVMGCGLLILIGGYFGRFRPATTEADSLKHW